MLYGKTRKWGQVRTRLTLNVGSRHVSAVAILSELERTTSEALKLINNRLI
jgi:hypothetical protein